MTIVPEVNDTGQDQHYRPRCPQYGHNTQSQRDGYLHVDTNRDERETETWATWRCLQKRPQNINSIIKLKLKQ